MRTLQSVVIEQKNLLAGETAGPWLWLAELHRDDTNIVRYTDDTRDTTFDGFTWAARSFQIEPAKPDAAGSIVNVELTLGNNDREISGFIENGEIKGQPATIYRVHFDLLSNPLNAVRWRGRVLDVKGDDTYVTLAIGNFNPDGAQIPGSRFSRTRCRWRFKSVECGYTAGLTTCDKSIQECEIRNNRERYGGFPGLPAVRP